MHNSGGRPQRYIEIGNRHYRCCGATRRPSCAVDAYRFDAVANPRPNTILTVLLFFPCLRHQINAQTRPAMIRAGTATAATSTITATPVLAGLSFAFGGGLGTGLFLASGSFGCDEDTGTGVGDNWFVIFIFAAGDASRLRQALLLARVISARQLVNTWGSTRHPHTSHIR